MNKFKLAMGLHNHQPVGNFDFVFEDAHQKAYQPFLELLAEYENIKISLHQSGILWNWQEKHHPEYLEQVSEMVKLGQLELMTGGFYEPILVAIPERDVREQIGRQNQYLEKRFGVKAEGLWLAERIWEPHLPRVLNWSGVNYLPVDDTHFIYAGLEQNQLTGPFVTEHENHKVTLLPISKRLRYLIPFGTIEELIGELRRWADKNPSGMIIYADDGEKFGSWPKTHEHCYHDKWLRRFFDAVEANSDWLEIVPLKTAAAARPIDLVYLPSASYAEMLHWSLPAEAFVTFEEAERYLKEQGLFDKYGRFLRGGHWRGFLSKYEEVNLMHKKMMAVSERVAYYKGKYPAEQKKLAQAQEKLLAGQCNCPYWHGVFGGLYLPHIRQAVYANLVEAERLLNEMEPEHVPTFTKLDFDCDGSTELLFNGKNLSAIIAPHRGGMLLDLSALQYNFVLTDTLCRRREGYHLKLTRATKEMSNTASIHDIVLAKEEGLERLLVEDRQLKRCFIDHFLALDSSFEEYRQVTYREEGDFADSSYDVLSSGNGVGLTLRRHGRLRRNGTEYPISLVKRYQFIDNMSMLEVVYELSTNPEFGFDVLFGVENNFNFQAGHAEDRFILVDGIRREESFLDSDGAYEEVESYIMIDQWRDLAVGMAVERECGLWHTPIQTVSLSEAGFERVYQGTTFLSLFRVPLSSSPQKICFKLAVGTEAEVMQKLRGQAVSNHLKLK